MREILSHYGLCCPIAQHVMLTRCTRGEYVVRQVASGEVGTEDYCTKMVQYIWYLPATACVVSVVAVNYAKLYTWYGAMIKRKKSYGSVLFTMVPLDTSSSS